MPRAPRRLFRSARVALLPIEPTRRLQGKRTRPPMAMRGPRATGLLEVRGTIDLGQFWPRGDSDGDIAKIVVRVAPDSFRFRAHAAVAGRPM